MKLKIAVISLSLLLLACSCSVFYRLGFFIVPESIMGMSYVEETKTTEQLIDFIVCYYYAKDSYQYSYNSFNSYYSFSTNLKRTLKNDFVNCGSVKEVEDVYAQINSYAEKNLCKVEIRGVEDPVALYKSVSLDIASQTIRDLLQSSIATDFQAFKEDASIIVEKYGLDWSDFDYQPLFDDVNDINAFEDILSQLDDLTGGDFLLGSVDFDCQQLFDKVNDIDELVDVLSRFEKLTGHVISLDDIDFSKLLISVDSMDLLIQSMTELSEKMGKTISWKNKSLEEKVESLFSIDSLEDYELSVSAVIKFECYCTLVDSFTSSVISLTTNLDEMNQVLNFLHSIVLSDSCNSITLVEDKILEQLIADVDSAQTIKQLDSIEVTYGLFPEKINEYIDLHEHATIQLVESAKEAIEKRTNEILFQEDITKVNSLRERILSEWFVQRIEANPEMTEIDKFVVELSRTLKKVEANLPEECSDEDRALISQGKELVDEMSGWSTWLKSSKLKQLKEAYGLENLDKEVYIGHNGYAYLDTGFTMKEILNHHNLSDFDIVITPSGFFEDERKLDRYVGKDNELSMEVVFEDGKAVITSATNTISFDYYADGYKVIQSIFDDFFNTDDWSLLAQNWYATYYF